MERQLEEKVTEKELLENFEQVQRWLRQLEEQCDSPSILEGFSSPPQRSPLVAEPIYRYEVHASS